MQSLLIVWIPTLASIATVTMVFFIGQYRSHLPFRMSRLLRPGIGTSALSLVGENTRAKAKRDNTQENCERAEREELEVIKHLYYQLHRLEEFPHVLPQAKRLLLALLKETCAGVQNPDQSILSIQKFSRQALYAFQSRLNNEIGDNWQHYNHRRNKGGERELFEDREEATWWLKQISPVKYVDGAWLGHIGKVTAPFALQKTMKGAWQILSEELGDGDLDKNHVHLFHKLLQTVAPGFPTAEELDFGHSRHQIDELSVWKAAIAQLLISLFPQEFLPEILGFNLHFEAVSMDTLKAARELKEIGLDPYYFILHVSIDNADSGHTAIAVDVVCEYMDYVRRIEGEETAQKAWKKVQAGYLLSLGLPGTTICPSRRKTTDDSNVALSSVETDVMKIFTAKAQVAHGIHCSSRVKIGTRSVAEWLDPIALQSKKWQMELLDALGRSKYWICRGDSNKSRFLQELQWNGRMFGSFTQSEFNILKKWIDGLSSISLTLGDSELGPDMEEDDILSGYPVFRPSTSFRECLPAPLPLGSPISYQSLPPLDIGNRPVFETFLPIWLSHPCLLQGFVSVPFRTKSRVVCAIVKILRAQGGFDIEQECVGGMCEVRRPNSLGLAGIGMNMMAQHGPSVASWPSLKHVLQAWPSEFAVHMLHISMRPMEYKGQLIGMSTAFAKMHVVIAECHLPLLSAQDRVTLQAISKRELEGLRFCWNELEADTEVYAECCKGYLIAEREIKKCFRF
ncbi:unnamed protein product [Diplocarpon coronariae]